MPARGARAIGCHAGRCSALFVAGGGVGEEFFGAAEHVQGFVPLQVGAVTQQAGVAILPVGEGCYQHKADGSASQFLDNLLSGGQFQVGNGSSP